MQIKIGTAILTSIAIGLISYSATAQQQDDLREAAAESFNEAQDTEKKQHKVDAAAQLKADKAICKEYGLTYGTKDFADCMMQIARDRKQQAVQEQAMAAQSDIQAAQQTTSLDCNQLRQEIKQDMKSAAIYDAAAQVPGSRPGLVLSAQMGAASAKADLQYKQAQAAQSCR